MKHFSDLQATDFELELCVHVSCAQPQPIQVLINQQTYYQGWITTDTLFSYQLPLLAPLSIAVLSDAVRVDQLAIDQWCLLPDYSYLAQQSPNKWQFEIHQPFYQWRHQITNQGMLLVLEPSLDL